MRLSHLGPESAESAYEFCARFPERCIFIAGWINEGGLARNARVPRGWLLAERSSRGQIEGLVYISSTGIVIPVLSSPSSLDAMEEIGRANQRSLRVIVGERRGVSDVWNRLRHLGLSARVIRDQLEYSVDRSGFRLPSDRIELDTASPEHLDLVVTASAAMAREEARDDPQARNPGLFRERILDRITRGRDFIHLRSGQLVFKANVSALSPLGGQIEGIYTLPSHRRRRIGIGGTAEVTAWVLKRADRATLLVNEDNEPARRLYADLGYRETLESQTIIIAP